MIDWITGVMSSFGYGGIALLMFLENLFPPIPSEVVMPLAGFTAAQGELSIIGVVIAGVAGSILGALPWYFAGHWYGADRLKRFAGRHGQWLTISPQDIDRSSHWFAQHGRGAVLIGRLVPGVRTLISVPAGVCAMNLSPFLFYSTVGTSGWTSVLAGAGYLLQEQWDVVGAYVGPISKIVLGLVVLWFAVRFLRQWQSRRRHPEQPQAGK
jgi:membrane protein DedA with SNARE-associated domain